MLNINTSDYDIQIFTNPNNSTLTTGWFSWNKPQGRSFLYGVFVGAGGGGGRPANGIVTSAAGGGGAGGVVTFFTPMFMLPDVLYLRPGFGGVGRTSTAGNGGISSQSYISLTPSATNYLFAIQAAAGGGQTVTGGLGGSVNIGSNAGMFIYKSANGASGGVGASSADTNGAGIVAQNSNTITTAGCGGGNGTGSGGNVTNYYSLPTINGGVGVIGGNGDSALPAELIYPLMTKYGVFTGGAGGGGISGAGAAGNGGNGNYGCGGGGGGGGRNASSTGGNGGNGGDGFIILVSY